MSKIGKMPVTIKDGVSVILDNRTAVVKGSKGELRYDLPEGILMTVNEGQVVLTQEEAKKEQTKALFGLARALVNNMVIGVSKGFEKKLELSGV